MWRRNLQLLRRLMGLELVRTKFLKICNFTSTSTAAFSIFESFSFTPPISSYFSNQRLQTFNEPLLMPHSIRNRPLFPSSFYVDLVNTYTKQKWQSLASWHRHSKQDNPFESLSKLGKTKSDSNSFEDERSTERKGEYRKMRFVRRSMNRRHWALRVVKRERNCPWVEIWMGKSEVERIYWISFGHDPLHVGRTLLWSSGLIQTGKSVDHTKVIDITRRPF